MERSNNVYSKSLNYVTSAANFEMWYEESKSDDWKADDS